jgi:hypothetical protein
MSIVQTISPMEKEISIIFNGSEVVNVIIDSEFGCVTATVDGVKNVNCGYIEDYKSQVKQSICKNKIIVSLNSTEHCVLMGVRLTFTASSVGTAVDAVKLIQQEYFDNQGSNGFFRLLPESHKSLASLDYVRGDIQHDPSVTNLSCVVNSPTSTVEILLCQRGYEEGLDAELKSTQAELDCFVNNGFAMSWEQFDLSN